MGPVAGVLTGLLTAASGVFVLPAVPYLQGLGLGRDALIRAMGLAFTVSTLALGAGLWWNASYDLWILAVSCLMLLPAVAGMQLGAMLRARLSVARFRFCFFVCLAGLGLHMLLRQWG
ncbi:putative membrane transporter protein [Kerstersia similis]